MTSFSSISITTHAHFVVLLGFRVLPIVPVVQAKTALPRLGHAHIVILAQARGEGGRLAARSAVPAGSRPLTVNITPATVTNTGPDHSGRSCRRKVAEDEKGRNHPDRCSTRFYSGDRLCQRCSHQRGR